MGAHGRLPALRAGILSARATAGAPEIVSAQRRGLGLARGPALAPRTALAPQRALARGPALAPRTALAPQRALARGPGLARGPALALAGLAAVWGVLASPPGASAAGGWSLPAFLSPCRAQAPAWVVFPSDSPSHATGAGAIVWEAAPGCAGGAGARVAAFGPGDAPRTSVSPRTAAGRTLALRGPLLAAGAPHGQIAIAGYLASGSPASGSPSGAASPAGAAGAAGPETSGGLLIQGAAGGPFAPLTAMGDTSAPTALATAYLGDLAIASPPPPGAPSSAPSPAPSGARAALQVRVERFYGDGISREAQAGSAGAGHVGALALALDYRSEALAVWSQRGAILAQLLPAKGPPAAVQRLAGGASEAHVAAVLSDDDHGIVAWSEQRHGETAVYLDRSADGVRFGAPELIEHFADPDGISAPAASPRLVRLSSEGVVMAWAGDTAGHWAVRVAPVGLSGMRAASTLAAPGADALLDGVAAGPDGEAFVLWSEPAPSLMGAPDMSLQALFAARGYASPGQTPLGQAQQVAPPGPVAGASIAVDPDSARAVVAWRGQDGAIEYATRTPGAG